MAKRGRGARVKGAAFERKLAKLLTEATKYEFKRGLGQARRGGGEISDVYSDDVPGIHIEAKRQVKCNIKAAMRQALNDIEKSGNEKIPIVITKDDREEILVTMNFDDWVSWFALALEDGL